MDPVGEKAWNWRDSRVRALAALARRAKGGLGVD